ncbi:hypothetical protein K502DRAFT_139531 [Neoconidiobolus thromboides FSU 785]|nr:hypothetical protein K502DRAFT_139531 [Neoconidiobolus thromboides FSU 785]
MGSTGVNVKEEANIIKKSALSATPYGDTRVDPKAQQHTATPPLLPFIDKDILAQKMNRIANQNGLNQIDRKVYDLISLAAEERVRSVIERMISASKHRVKNHQNFPQPEVNPNGRPEYKIQVNLDSKRHITVLERIDREEERLMRQRIEQGIELEDDPKSKRSKTKKDNSATNPKNLSEDNRKLLANQTAAFVTGSVPKSWMTSTPISSSPRLNSPLVKNNYKPTVSSNLVPKQTATHGSSPLGNKPYSTLSTPSTPRYNSSFGKNAPRVLTIQDALFVLESDQLTAPASNSKKLIISKYSNLN